MCNKRGFCHTLLHTNEWCPATAMWVQECVANHVTARSNSRLAGELIAMERTRVLVSNRAWLQVEHA